MQSLQNQSLILKAVHLLDNSSAIIANFIFRIPFYHFTHDVLKQMSTQQHLLAVRGEVQRKALTR